MIEINDNTINICIDSLAAQVADSYAEEQNISVTDAIRFFFSTKTYELLANPMSYLYLESAAYVENMLDAELDGDWERWMEI